MMKRYFLHTLQVAPLLWGVLTLGVIASSILYAALNVAGVSEVTILLIAFIFRSSIKDTQSHFSISKPITFPNFLLILLLLADFHKFDWFLVPLVIFFDIHSPEKGNVFPSILLLVH